MSHMWRTTRVIEVITRLDLQYSDFCVGNTPHTPIATMPSLISVQIANALGTAAQPLS